VMPWIASCGAGFLPALLRRHEFGHVALYARWPTLEP
jgi:hypothetical protein